MNVKKMTNVSGRLSQNDPAGCQAFRPITKTVAVVLLVLNLIPLSAYGQEIQNLDSIRLTAEQYALEQLQGQHYSNLRAQATSLDSRLRLASCSSALEAFSMSANNGAGRTTIGVRCPGESPWTLYVPVEIQAEVNVVTASRSLQRGERLAEGDFRVESRPLQQLPLNYLSNPEQLADLELTRPVNGGTILSANMFRSRQVVSRGQEVTIYAGGGGVEVRMNGVALEGGTAGQRISVRNSNSGRTVQATVIDEHRVSVSP